MIPFTSDAPIGYPAPMLNWRTGEVRPSNNFTYFDDKSQILKTNASSVYSPVYSPSYAPGFGANLFPLGNTYDPLWQTAKPIKPNLFTPYVVNSFPTVVGTNWFDYDDVDADPEFRNKIVRFFRDKTLVWLKSSFSDLLNYFVIRNGQVELSKDHKDYDRENKDSDDVKNKKIEYIHYNILSKKFIAKSLEHYANTRQMKWWNLRDNKDIVKQSLYDELKQKIKKLAE